MANKNFKEKLKETVNPVVGYVVFFGALALAIGIGLLVCL